MVKILIVKTNQLKVIIQNSKTFIKKLTQMLSVPGWAQPCGSAATFPKRYANM